MGFWGIEVKPGKPYPYHADNVPGKLHVTQATLGIGSTSEKSILQCSSGHKSPVFLCSLLPDTIESCPLNLEFDADDLVAFSVIGKRSVHLSGYFAAADGDDLRDDYEYDSWGEDIEGTETDESSEFDSEDDYGDDFIVDSDVDYPSSPVPNSGVVIEEIVDDDKPENIDDSTKKLKKKKQVALLKEKDSKSSELPNVVESEDEDGFPVSTGEKGASVSQTAEEEMEGEQAHKKSEKGKKKEKDVDHPASLKRKFDRADKDEPQDGKKKKEKNKLKEHIKGESGNASGNSNEAAAPGEKHPEPEEVKTTTNLSNVPPTTDEHDEKLSNNKVLAEKKNKNKKKKKSKESDEVAAANQITTDEKQNLSTSEKKGKKQTETKPSQVRTFPNGLVIEELIMGKPDGKKAAPGKKVSVKYIGKLQKDGKIFDSNVGRAPFKFRLGVGQVIKGWEVGINGMRIGDKRRITIPPSMGYGDRRVGSIPPNSWLVFDVELVDVDR